MSKYHLANINKKESSKTDCVVNKKSVEISNELGQSLLGVQIYPNFGQNSESEPFAGRSKRITSKVDFNIIRDPNIPLGLVNYGENVCFFNSVIQVQQKEKTNLSKVESPVKRKSEFTNRSSKENDKKRKKLCVITLVKMKKNS